MRPAPDPAFAPSAPRAPTLRGALEAAGHPFGGHRGYAVAGPPDGRAAVLRTVLRPDGTGPCGAVRLGAVVLPGAAVGRHLVVLAGRVPRAPEALVRAVVVACLGGPAPPVLARAAASAIRALFVTVTVAGPDPGGGYGAVEVSGSLPSAAPEAWSAALRSAPAPRRRAPRTVGRPAVVLRPGGSEPGPVPLGLDLGRWAS